MIITPTDPRNNGYDNYWYPQIPRGYPYGITECCLWVRPYIYNFYPQRICYQPQGGAVVCVEGDSYNLSEIPSSATFTTKVVFNWWNYQNSGSFCSPNIERFYTNDLPLDFKSFIGYRTAGQGAYCAGGTFLYFDYLDINDQPKSMEIPQARTGASGVSSGSLASPINNSGSSLYKIEIFKSNQKIHEYTSSNPISAWVEPSSYNCTLSENLTVRACWRQWASDRLVRRRQGDQLFFYLIRKQLDRDPLRLYESLPDFPVTIEPITSLYKDKNCGFPHYQIDCFPGSPNERCKKISCKDNEYWDEKECKCKPKKIPKPRCPECPPNTKYECRSDGYLCCYDECYNVIARFPIPPKCK